MSWIMDKDQHESRLNHLLQTGAFRDAKLPLGQSRRQFAHRALKRWYKFNEGCDIITAERTWRQLKADMKGYDLPAPDPKALVSYHSIPSTPQTHLVLDPNGRILAYKFRVPLNLIATLASSSEQLPPKSVQCQRRGHFECSHFALWADSSPDLMILTIHYFVKSPLPVISSYLRLFTKTDRYKWVSTNFKIAGLYNHSGGDTVVQMNARVLDQHRPSPESGSGRGRPANPGPAPAAFRRRTRPA